MTVDFQKLMQVPIDDVKRPSTCPPGHYGGMISSFEFGESSQKKTPFLRFHLTLNAPGDDVDMDDFNSADPPIDLSKKQFRKDFYLTDTAMFMLKDFIESFGDISTAGKKFDSILPDLVNKSVNVELRRSPTQDGGGFRNEVGDVAGA